MPVPEDISYYRICADEFLYNLAPIFGNVKTIRKTLGDYRRHGASIYSARPFDERLQLEVEGHTQQCKILSKVLARHGVKVDLDAWYRHSWFGRLTMAIDQINHLIPEQERFLLVDSNTWGAGEIFGERAVPVMEHEGQPWGDPADTKAFFGEIERQRQLDVKFLVFAWPAFWWLDYYEGLTEALETNATCLAQDDLLAVYELAPIEQPDITSSGDNQQRENPS